ncbi:MAG: transcription-repair coupling factor [Myxococcales bacterium]|nr:transcription-repair coupling factor [Myxococcales bacterium]
METQTYIPEPVRGSATALEELVDAVARGRKKLRARGLFGAARGFALKQLVQAAKRTLVCIEPDEEAAEALEKDLRFFGIDVARLPADEVLPYEGISPDRMVAQQRLASLFRLHLGQGAQVIVSSVRGLARRVLPRAALDKRSMLVSLEMEQDRDDLARKLTAAGYIKTPLVEDPGTYAVRGGVFDVWSPLDPQPARLEFFGDLVEKIRVFDPQTQRTVREVTELSLCPAREIVLDEEGRKAAIATVRAAADAVEAPSRQLRELIDELGTHSQAEGDGSAGARAEAAGWSIGDELFAAGLSAILPGFYPGGLSPITEYLPKDALWVLDDPLELERQWGDLWKGLEESFDAARRKGELALPPDQHFLHERDVRPILESSSVLELSGISITDASTDTQEIEFELQPTGDLRAEIAGHHGEDGALTPLVRRLESLREQGTVAIIACHSSAQAERTRRLLLDRNLMAQIVALENATYSPHIHAHLVTGEISKGFVDPHQRLGVFSDEDVFGPRAVARKASRKPRTFGEEGADFRDLKEGDLVVHVDHGIARYDGLTRLNVRGFAADFILLQFAGKDKLYLPVGRLRQIQKYAGGDPAKVKLDSLKSQTFQKRKARVKEELLKMAAELLDIYAARAAHLGYAYSPPDAMYRTFEADFEFEETPDQEKAIEDVLRDMQQPKPMDRLICGDVGYGKTEVALRASFKAVEDKKQVAILVPTTVLAAQHYRTMSKRFADYPVIVEMVSRLRDEKQIQEVLARTREGKVDVLIGTHRLLSPDVGFKDLGLVVVDEEQRFGVKHKEQLKKLRKLVDVLTLTATPIPRTLHMAMMGVRDLSIIGTPPVDRRAIRTFVSKFDGATIKEAIERELARGGQVFFLHNRIESIAGVYEYLRRLVPQARIAIAHGQMQEGKLEKVMTDFIDRKHDVLLCTAIIESGLDIPSANTILVDRADHFGLSQLYQIRGRVGRSRERAYAHLLIPARRTITRDAQKRLQVLQQFTELGAGFQVASHDLEIRGAGNLLGPDQSGNIASVGFDLYTQLMEEAVASIKGEEIRKEYEPDVELPIPALIPEDYVPEVQQRLFFYKRLASATSEEALYDVKGELRDQCGEPPPEVDALVELMSLKNELRALRMRGLKSGPGRLVLQLGPDAALDPVKLAQLVAKAKGRYRLTPGMELVATVDEEANVLESARSLLQDLRRAAVA